LLQLLAQRVFSIACGYPDGNDSARLGADPVHKMLLERDPVSGLDLASQPTLSRFENAVGAKELYRVGESLALSVMERHRKRLRGKGRLVMQFARVIAAVTGGTEQFYHDGNYAARSWSRERRVIIKQRSFGARAKTPKTTRAS
jgi:Transposase DDE domain group 1